MREHEGKAYWKYKVPNGHACMQAVWEENKLITINIFRSEWKVNTVFLLAKIKKFGEVRNKYELPIQGCARVQRYIYFVLKMVSDLIGKPCTNDSNSVSMDDRGIIRL